jgi:hypothetical protein
MELSMLCDVKVFLFLFDKNTDAKLMHYQTDPRDDFIQYMFKDCCSPKNFYSDEHYKQVLLRGPDGLR